MRSVKRCNETTVGEAGVNRNERPKSGLFGRLRLIYVVEEACVVESLWVLSSVADADGDFNNGWMDGWMGDHEKTVISRLKQVHIVGLVAKTIDYYS